MEHWTLILKRLQRGWQWLWRKPRFWLGIVITPDTVRVALVQRNGAAWQLIHTLTEPVLNDDAATALRRVKARLNRRVHHVVMALPTDAVMRLTLDVSAEMSDAELVVWVRQELVQRTGLNDEALAVDFRHHTATSVEVVAARCEQVQVLEAQAQQAQLPLHAIESEWHALERICRHVPTQAAVGVWVVSAQRVGLYVFHERRIQTCRILAWEAVPSASVEQRTETLIQHAQRAWSFVLAAGVAPQQLWLSGEYADFPHLADQLAAHFQRECRPVAVPLLANGGEPAFFMALGLALWGLENG